MTIFKKVMPELIGLDKGVSLQGIFGEPPTECSLSLDGISFRVAQIRTYTKALESGDFRLEQISLALHQVSWLPTLVYSSKQAMLDNYRSDVTTGLLCAKDQVEATQWENTMAVATRSSLALFKGCSFMWVSMNQPSRRFALENCCQQTSITKIFMATNLIFNPSQIMNIDPQGNVL